MVEISGNNNNRASGIYNNQNASSTAGNSSYQNASTAGNSSNQLRLNQGDLVRINSELKGLINHKSQHMSVYKKLQKALVKNSSVITGVLNQLPISSELKAAFQAIQVVTGDPSSARRLVYLNYVKLALASIYLIAIFAFMCSEPGMKFIQDMKDPFSLSFVKQFFTVLKEAIYYLSYFFIKIFPITSQANIAVTGENLLIAKESFSFGIDAIAIILDMSRREISTARKIIQGGTAVTARAGVMVGRTVMSLLFANVTRNFVNYISDGGNKSIPDILLDAFNEIDNYEQTFEKHEGKISKVNYLAVCLNLLFNIKGGEAASTPKDVIIGIGLTAFQNINCVIAKTFLESSGVVISDVARRISALEHKDQMIQYNELLKAKISQTLQANPHLLKKLSMGNRYIVSNLINRLPPQQQQLYLQY